MFLSPEHVTLNLRSGDLPGGDLTGWRISPNILRLSWLKSHLFREGFLDHMRQNSCHLPSSGFVPLLQQEMAVVDELAGPGLVSWWLMEDCSPSCVREGGIQSQSQAREPHRMQSVASCLFPSWLCKNSDTDWQSFTCPFITVQGRSSAQSMAAEEGASEGLVLALFRCPACLCVCLSLPFPYCSP